MLTYLLLYNIMTIPSNFIGGKFPQQLRRGDTMVQNKKITEQELCHAFTTWKEFGFFDYSWMTNFSFMLLILVTGMISNWDEVHIESITLFGYSAIGGCVTLCILSFVVNDVFDRKNKKRLQEFYQHHPELSHIPEHIFLNIYYISDRPNYMKK